MPREHQGGGGLFNKLLDDGAGVGACAACKPVRRKLVELARTSHQDGSVPVIRFVVAHSGGREAGERWSQRNEAERGRVSSSTTGTATASRSCREEDDDEMAYM